MTWQLMQFASLDSYANHPEDEVLRARPYLNCYLILVTIEMPVSEVNVSDQPALAVCTSIYRSIALAAPWPTSSPKAWSSALHKRTKSYFWNYRTQSFHNINTTFEECITQLTSNQKFMVPFLLGSWRHLTAFTWLKSVQHRKCRLGIYIAAEPLQLSIQQSFLLDFLFCSFIKQKILFGCSFLKMVCLPQHHLLYLDLISQVFLPSVKAWFESILS